MGNSHTLDLHGIRHHEADRIVENFIFMNQNRVPLKIITGNSQKMIDIVFGVIRRNKITHAAMEHYGAIHVYKV